MQPMWICFPGLPQESEPQANLKASEWDGCDDVPAGAELWGGRNSVEQSWHGIGKTSVYRAVQEVARQVPGMKQEKLVDGYKTEAVGADVTSVRCNGKWVTVGVAVDATNGMVLSIDELPGEDAE